MGKILTLGLSIALLSGIATADTQIVRHMGKSCQICIKSGNTEVCRYFKKCPIKKKRK